MVLFNVQCDLRQEDVDTSLLPSLLSDPFSFLPLVPFLAFLRLSTNPFSIDSLLPASHNSHHEELHHLCTTHKCIFNGNRFVIFQSI